MNNETFLWGSQKVDSIVIRKCRGAKKAKSASVCAEPGCLPQNRGPCWSDMDSMLPPLPCDQAQLHELLLLPALPILRRDSEKAVHFPGLTKRQLPTGDDWTATRHNFLLRIAPNCLNFLH